MEFIIYTLFTISVISFIYCFLFTLNFEDNSNKLNDILNEKFGWHYKPYHFRAVFFMMTTLIINIMLSTVIALLQKYCGMETYLSVILFLLWLFYMGQLTYAHYSITYDDEVNSNDKSQKNLVNSIKINNSDIIINTQNSNIIHMDGAEFSIINENTNTIFISNGGLTIIKQNSDVVEIIDEGVVIDNLNSDTIKIKNGVITITKENSDKTHIDMVNGELNVRDMHIEAFQERLNRIYEKVKNTKNG